MKIVTEALLTNLLTDRPSKKCIRATFATVNCPVVIIWNDTWWFIRVREKQYTRQNRKHQGYWTYFVFVFIVFVGEKPFECDICKRRFREQSDLRKHKKVHNNDTKSKCSACNRYPPASRHSSKCIACEKQEAAAKLYQESLVADDLVPRIDANNKKSFICKYCDRSFGSSSNLKRHIMIHTGEKKILCFINWIDLLIYRA